MPLETVRVSKDGRDKLIKLKRLTGIENWNVICRWAFCASLAEPSPPREQRIPVDSSIEMTWRTFGGDCDAIYWALLRARCRRDRIELSDGNLATQFRLHLHRGINYLAGDPTLRSISALVRKAVNLKNDGS